MKTQDDVSEKFPNLLIHFHLSSYFSQGSFVCKLQETSQQGSFKKDICIMVQCYLRAEIHLNPTGVKLLTKSQPEHSSHDPGPPASGSSSLAVQLLTCV